jgi:hypothetical protein
MGIISVFDGNEVDEFIETVINVYKKQGKGRGGRERIEVLIGKKSRNAVYVPIVTTRGIEQGYITGINEEDIQKIEGKFREEGITISFRPRIVITED